MVPKLGKFADDTKLCRGISNSSDANLLMSILDWIYQLYLHWQMLFIVYKCTVQYRTVLHMGNKNPKYEYKFGENVINSSITEIDLQ